MRKIYLLTVILALALCLAVTSHALASGPDSGNDELVLSSSVAHTFALFEDDETIGLSHANPVGYVMIDHYDYWADRLEGVPQWSLTYETDKGAAFACEVWENFGNEGCSMRVSQYPEDPVIVHYIVDEPVPYFEDEVYYRERYIAPVQDPHSNRTVTIADIIGICPDNYDELLAAYGPDSDANWTLEHVSGPSFTYNLQHKVEQFIYVMMRGEPNGPSTSTYRLTCSWGSHSGSVLILTNFKETDLPSGQTVNGQKNRNVYFMKRGESQVFSFGLQNSAGFVPVDVVVNYNPNQLAVERNGLDVTFTPLVNGAIPINVNIRTRADMNSPVCNVRVISEMALLVTEDGEWTSLDLPRSLTTIDEEAFMGTSANVVTLQGRVETIGPRAFANSPSLMSVNLPASLTTIDPSAFDEEVILVAKTEDLFFWAVENNFNVLYIP